MTPPKAPTCAVWYFRYGHVYCKTHDTEVEAATAAVRMEDFGEGSVKGVQFSDGRFVDRGDWEAYDAESRRLSEQYRAEARRIKNIPVPPKRTVKAPWDRTLTAKVLAETPEWVGA